MADRNAPASSRVTAARSVSHVRRLRPARFEAREIEQRVDELQQSAGIAVQDVDLRPLAIGQRTVRAGQEILGRVRASRSAACGTRG